MTSMSPDGMSPNGGSHHADGRFVLLIDVRPGHGVDEEDHVVTTEDSAVGIAPLGDRSAFTLARHDIRPAAPAVVGSGDDVRVRTARLDALRDGAGLHVGLRDAAETEPRVFYGFGTGEVRARVGDREVVARVDAEGAWASVLDDIDVRVSPAGRAEVQCAHTAFVLDPDTGRTALTCADGHAELVRSSGFEVSCARTGWRVTASTATVVIESVNGQAATIVWDRRTGALEVSECPHWKLSTQDRDAAVGVCADCGVAPDARWRGEDFEFTSAGLCVRWSAGALTASADDGWFAVSGASAVRIRWGDRDLVAHEGRVLAADIAEDWYVTTDGRLTTCASLVSATRAIDGTLEVDVRSVEDDGTALVWAHGVYVDDGHGLRTMLGDSGRVLCASASRADHNVVAEPDGAVTVTADTATVELAHAGMIRLHDSGASPDRWT